MSEKANLFYLAAARQIRADRMKDQALSHSVFESVVEMDEHVSRYVNAEVDRLSETALILLGVLTSHSCVVPGVSWLSVKSMAEKCGVVDRTVQNALKTLEKAGIIKRLVSQQTNGGQGCNFIVIQRNSFLDAEVADQLEASKSECEAAALTEIAAGGSFTPVFTAVFAGDCAQNNINSFNLLNPKNEEEEYNYLAFRRLIKSNDIPETLETAICREVPNLLSYTIDAISRTFKKMMNRIRQGTIYHIPRWFATTITGEELFVREQQREEARVRRALLA